jgi:succinate dehydrogenase/fumarate reductase flavoprotein subunit
MIAVGRWVYLSDSERTESRVMHQRDDYPERDPRQRQRILVKGVDKPEVSVAAIADPVVPYEDALTQRAA